MEEKDQLNFIARRIMGAAIEVPRHIEGIAPIHDAQLLSYLRVSRERVGLIINFPVRLPKNGLNRIVNEFPDAACSAVSKKAENGSDL